MLKPGVRAFSSLWTWLSGAGQECSELRLDAKTEGGVLLRSTDVLAVWRDCELAKGLELVLDMVGVAEVMDQFRRELVRIGTSSISSKRVLLEAGDFRLCVRG